MGSAHTAMEGGRRIILQGAGESEANGVYIECVEQHDGKPQFKYTGKSRNNDPIILWWAKSGAQWSLRKESAGFFWGSNMKLWYIASATTGADVSGDMPPTAGWAVSAKSAPKPTGPSYTSTPRKAIGPAPSITLLAAGEEVPSKVAQDMETRAAEYAAGKYG